MKVHASNQTGMVSAANRPSSTFPATLVTDKPAVDANLRKSHCDTYVDRTIDAVDGLSPPLSTTVGGARLLFLRVTTHHPEVAGHKSKDQLLSISQHNRL